MNQRNRRLRDHFIAGKEYVSRADNRSVIINKDYDLIDGQTITNIIGTLYTSAIVKRTIDENGYNTFWINYSNWRTRTTTAAIKACIPGGWEIRGYKLYTPKLATITIPNTGWVELKEPLDAYLDRWS